jgi:hypothetical protein
MWRAYQELRRRFKPEETAEGKPPPNAMIGASLRAGIRQRHDRPADDHDLAPILNPFTAFINKYANQLMLTGTRPAGRPERGGKTADGEAVPSREEVLAVVERAIALSPEINRYFEAMPQPDAARRGKTPRALHNEALAIVSDLQRARSGRDALRGISDRQTTHLATLRVFEIRDLMRIAYYEATTSIDRHAADSVMARIGGEIGEWIASAGAEAAAGAEILTSAVRVYVGYWLASSLGRNPDRLTFAEDAIENAIITVGSDIGDRERRRRFAGLAQQLIHHIIRSDDRRGRMPRPAGADAAGAESPRVRTIITPQDLMGAIGPELYGELSTFYAAVRGGTTGEFAGEQERDIAARNFFEFILHYIRYACNTCGGDLAARLRQEGLEARFTEAILARVDDPTRFTPAVIELVRDFFHRHIRENPPGLAELFAKHAGTSGESGSAANFICPRDTMAEFVAQIPGIGKEQREDFEIETGISWDAFTLRGQVRANPDELPQRTWDAIVEFAAEGGNSAVESLLTEHIPPSVDEETWLTQISGAGSTGGTALKDLAKAHKPASLTDGEWENYIGRLRAANRLEDATVEPRRGKSLDATLPAYLFLQKIAVTHGLAIDFFDYLAAIYPIARRLRAQAVDGRINVTIPRFMRDLPFHYWGYPTWADQVLAGGVETDVVRATLIGHSRMDQNPEYWDIRRYTVPLAASTGGGAEQEERLYEFAAGLMR